jgi:hypothetical protein
MVDKGYFANGDAAATADSVPGLEAIYMQQNSKANMRDSTLLVHEICDFYFP